VIALKAAGYEALSEGGAWKLQPGGKYFFTRSQSSLVAFAIGGKFVCSIVVGFV